jgi:hypothetical protein
VRKVLQRGNHQQSAVKYDPIVIGFKISYPITALIILAIAKLLHYY